MKIKSIANAVSWNVTKALRYIQNIDEAFWKPKEHIDLDALFEKRGNASDFYFVQIGANDGVTGDSLRPFITRLQWKGVLVEPVPYIYKRLVENYEGYRGLHFENSAIGIEDGYQNFYALSEFDLQNNRLFTDYNKYKIDQLGSFNKETLLKHSFMHPQFEKLIEEVKVPTLTFNSLLNKYNIKKIDLLQIDAEGYDFELLNSIKFDKVIPGILVFEHQHLTKNDYKTSVEKLRKVGYKFYVNNWDTVCILRT